MSSGVFTLPPPARRPRLGLTPMIDVIFLMLVFFMLTARFGAETTISVRAAGDGTGAYRGAPRLVEIGPDRLRLNGSEIGIDALPAALSPLMPDSDAMVVLLPRQGANLQDVTEVIDTLAREGIRRVVLAEDRR